MLIWTIVTEVIIIVQPLIFVKIEIVCRFGIEWMETMIYVIPVIGRLWIDLEVTSENVDMKTHMLQLNCVQSKQGFMWNQS